jgi:hypothetical protein
VEVTVRAETSGSVVPLLLPMAYILLLLLLVLVLK